MRYYKHRSTSDGMHFMWSLCLIRILLSSQCIQRATLPSYNASNIYMLPSTITCYIYWDMGELLLLIIDGLFTVYASVAKILKHFINIYLKNIIGHAIRRCAMGNWRIRHFGDMHNSGVYIYNILPCISILLCIT